MNFKILFEIIRDSYLAFNADKVPRLGAALSYFVFSSIAPLLVVAVGIAGIVLGRTNAQQQIISSVYTSLGKDTAQALDDLIVRAAQPSTGLVATIIGLVLAFFAASGIFSQIKDALNTVWDIKPIPPKNGILGLIFARLFSILGVLVFGVFVIAFLAARVALSSFSSQLGLENPVLLGFLSNALSIVLFTVLFALTYKFMPDVQLPWKDVWLGAFVTALLFTLGQYAIGFYLGHSSPSSVYGAAGSLVVILIWIYFSSQILFFGAEITWVYAQKQGSRSFPDSSVPLEQKTQEIPVSASSPLPVLVKEKPRSSLGAGLVGAGLGAVIATLLLPLVLLGLLSRAFKRE